MKSWLLLGACGAIVVAAGCGSSFTGTGGAGGSGTTSSTGKGSTSASNGTTTGTATGGAGGAGVSSSTGGTTTTVATSGSGGGGAACPDEIGAYKVATVGQDCGSLSVDVKECIKAGANTCDVQIVASQTASGQGVTAAVTLDMSGGFSSAMVVIGGTTRSGCTGTWDAATSVLSINCGGTGTSQSCTAILTRTGNDCPF